MKSTYERHEPTRREFLKRAGRTATAGIAFAAAPGYVHQTQTPSVNEARVNTVAPGPIQTKMLDRFVGGDEQMKAGFLATIPAKRSATAEEIAQAILLVASDKAPYLTGQSVSVDGGYTAQ
jgi:NAD(P)-dependent dehydrogenase (short-subunit alcohol dehydrogenase family)